MNITQRMFEEALYATTYVGKHFFIDFRKVNILGCYGITKVFYLCAWDDTSEAFVSDTLFVVTNFDDDGKPLIDHGFTEE